MATVVKNAKMTSRSNRLPVWMTVSLVLTLGVLVYGLLAPKHQSAFDRPEAQMNDQPAPWVQPRSF